MDVFEVDGTEPLGNGKYKIYVEMGRDSTGKRRRRTKTVTPTSERNLRKLKRDFEIQCHEEKDEPLENITFSSFVDRWIKNHVEPELTNSTFNAYNNALKHSVLKHFEKMKMKDIKKFHIAEYLAKRGTSLEVRYTVLKSIFGKAHEWEVITSNPTENVKMPPLERRKFDIYDEKELQILFDVLNSAYPKHRIGIKLAAIGGLRRAEIGGIREECINYEENSIYIDKQLLYDKEIGLYMSPVKNKKPRTVVFPSEFMQELKTFHTEIKKMRMAMGNAWKPLIENDEPVNLIFVNDEGYPTHPHTLSTEFQKIIKKYNLKQIRFHDLRHSCASLMVVKNVNFKIIQERLGHADIGQTLNTYSHLRKEQHIESVEVFSDLV